MKKIIPLYKTLLDSGDSFSVESTNNFYKINHNGVNFKFFAGEKPNFAVFNIARLIKSQVEQNDHIGVTNHNIEEYFDYNKNFDYSFNKKWYCIDLTKAYQTLLRNKGLIDNDLYLKICELPKKDRLKVTGMIARRKTKYYYDNGRMTYIEIDRMPTEKYFFYCVEQTYLIMSKISKKLKSDFIFFWVDCVFFSGEENINWITDFLNSNRMSSKLERIRPLGISESKQYNTFRFYKSGKYKDYNVPKIKPVDLLAKAKSCFINQDFKGWKYYYEEYSNICTGISKA